MFGWSMFFGVLGAIAFLVAGALFIAHREQKEKSQIQKSFPYSAVCVLGVILFSVSYYYFYWHFAGKITTPDWLDPEMIYRVGGQAKIEEQNAAFLGNAGKDVWCVASEPIDPQARSVRAVKTPDGKWRLEALDIPQAEK